MYLTLLVTHSLLRWLVLTSLLYTIYRAYKGYTTKQPFTKADNLIRHATATIAHIQLTAGILLYSKSPVVKSFLLSKHIPASEATFFGVLHITLMVAAIVVITIGSSLAKRKTLDEEKFKTLLIWYSIALVIILIAIPWPFSPLAHRPYLRLF